VAEITIQKIKYIADILQDSLADLKYKGNISFAICKEIGTHWERDIAKLEQNQSNGVAIEKIIGYFSFWVRKLQPISEAHPVVKEDGILVKKIEQTNTHINELVSIHGIKLLALKYFDAMEKFENHLGNTNRALSYKEDAEKLEEKFNVLFDAINTEDLYRSFLQICLYDMRFRTFGPHHLTHAVRFLMFMSDINLKKINAAYSNSFIHSSMQRKIVLHMKIFISAPGDVQKEILNNSKSLLNPKNIIKEKYQYWIDNFGVAVTCISQIDVPAGRDQNSAQNAVNKFVDEQSIDVYYGLIKHRFGTKTVAGYGSGTEEEYNEAITKISDGGFIAFGIYSNDEPFNNKTPEAQVKNIKANKKKIDAFRKTYGDKQFMFFWDEKNFKEIFIKEVENKIKLYKK
jgi:hypothetical protein